MKLLVDMNLSPRWVTTFADAGIDAIRQMSDALESGALITIEPGRTRARLLPLTVTEPTPQTFEETPTTVKDQPC